MSRFLAAWRKPGRPAPRPRRDWHPDLGLFCAAPSADDPGPGREQGWFESSRDLASGLEVTEDPPEAGTD